MIKVHLGSSLTWAPLALKSGNQSLSPSSPTTTSSPTIQSAIIITRTSKKTTNPLKTSSWHSATVWNFPRSVAQLLLSKKILRKKAQTDLCCSTATKISARPPQTTTTSSTTGVWAASESPRRELSTWWSKMVTITWSIKETRWFPLESQQITHTDPLINRTPNSLQESKIGRVEGAWWFWKKRDRWKVITKI